MKEERQTIPDQYLNEVCKIGQGRDCCGYLVASSEGMECAKGTVFEDVIRRRMPTLVAQGDNCDGYNTTRH